VVAVREYKGGVRASKNDDHKRPRPSRSEV
jgi:hypothetical protein